MWVFIFGIILMIFLTPMLAVYSCIGLMYRPANWRKYLPFFILLIGIIAYSYKPLTSEDLVRYIEMLEQCRNMTLTEVFLYFNDSLFVKNVIFWGLSKLDEPHILPAISSATVYGIAGYITCDMAETWHCEKYIPLVLMWQTLLLPFFSITSNIRYVCAFSIIILAVYLEIEKKKRNILIIALYICPCFIHTTAWILVVLRLLVFLVDRFKLLPLLTVFSLPVLTNFLYQFKGKNWTKSNTINFIVNHTIVKAYWYLKGDDAEILINSGYQRANRMVVLLLTIGFVILIIMLSREIKERSQFMTYMFLICIVTLAFFSFQYPHYWRFAAAYAILIGVVLFPVLSIWDNVGIKKKCIVYFLGFLSLIEQILQIWFSHYKVNYFEL